MSPNDLEKEIEKLWRRTFLLAIFVLFLFLIVLFK